MKAAHRVPHPRAVRLQEGTPVRRDRGPARPTDRGLSRRDLLRAGGLGGVTIWAGPGDDRERAADPRRHPAFGVARSCLVVFLGGGPSHLDTFEPKPDAPAAVRGGFRPIATGAPGVMICEHLPRLARQAG